MDLKSLLGPSEAKTTVETTTPTVEKPELRKRYSSINDLVNNDDVSLSSSSPIPQHTKSPIPLNKSIPSSVPTLNSGINTTPSGHVIHTIKARNSISSLTNETDVDIDGKETPSIARRLSYDFLSASESNSPNLPKKSIPRQSSLQDMIHKPIEVEEPIEETQDSLETVKLYHKNTVADVVPKDPIVEESPIKNETIDTPQKNLQKIKPKPKRYTNPPIWATRWNPKGKKLGNSLNHETGTNNYNNNNNNHVNVNHTDKIFNKNNHAYSITGVKPYNDLTRRITNWIYAQIHSIPKEKRQYLELEVKFGKLWDKKTDRRVYIPVTNETLVEEGFALNCYFKPGLEKDTFDKLKKHLVNLTKLNKDNFKTLKFDQVDKQYREALRGQIPKYYRLTTDKITNRIVANIEKRKISSIFIHTPDLNFDYRLSLSLELPSFEDPIRFQDHTPELERHKKRVSIFHDSTATRFDLTEVIQRNKGKNNLDIDTLEVELEIDMEKLIQAYDNLENDSFTFEDLSEVLLDNARILNRELIKPNK